MRDALTRIGRIADPPLEPIVPAASQYGYRNKLEYSFTESEDGVDLGFHRAGPLGRGHRDRGVPSDDRPRQRRSARRARLGAGGEARAVRPGDGRRATSATSSYREGRNTGQALVLLVTAPGERFETGYFVDVLRRFPEVRSIHWAINDTPAEQTNLPTRLLWGEEAIEEEILGLRFRSARARSCRRTRRWPRGCTSSRASTRRSTGSENVFDLYCGTGTIGLALARWREAVWGVEISEESVACAIENAELNEIENAQFFAGNVGQSLEELRSGQARPTSSSSIRRAPGSRARRCAGRASSEADRDRLRLLQPDDARLGRAGAARRVRLRARADAPGRHVPAHAARRVGLPARARLTLVSRPLRCCGGRATLRARGARGGRRSGAGSRCRPRGAPAGRRSSHSQTSTSVSARTPVIASHVQPTRRPNRRGRREEEREEDDVGRAEVHAPVSPGSGTRPRSARRSPAAPRRRTRSARTQTDQTSTQGTITATSATHQSSSNSARNQKPTRANAASFATFAAASAPTRSRPTTRAPRRPRPRRGDAAASRATRGARARSSPERGQDEERDERRRPARAAGRAADRRRRRTRRARRAARRARVRAGGRSVRRLLRPPRAERLERVPERGLRRLPRRATRRCPASRAPRSWA